MADFGEDTGGTGGAGALGRPVVLGTFFGTTVDMRTAVEQWLLGSGKALRCGNGGGKQKRYFCTGAATGCKFVVRGTKQRSGDWKVSFVDPIHESCAGPTRTPSNRAMLGVIGGIVRPDTTMKSTAVRRAVQEATGATMHLRSVNRAKTSVCAENVSETRDTHARLTSYCEQIGRNCPGSVAVVERDGTGRFERCFVMLGSAAHVAANSVPKLFTVNEGHLKGDWNGIFIVLSCKDSNNSFVHVATVVADKENASNYCFLLEMAKRNEEFRLFLSDKRTTCYSVGHKGCPSALKKEVPLAQHRLCLEHLLDNCRPAFGQDNTRRIFEAAKAPSISLFTELMAPVMVAKPTSYEALMKIPTPHWTHHATCAGNVVLDQVTSHLAESTMNMVDSETRELDVYHFIETIMIQTAGKLAERSRIGMNTPQTHTPFASEAFENERLKSLALEVCPLGNGGYIVRPYGRGEVGCRVTLSFGATPPLHEMCCTCAFPSRYRIPCKHVLAVCKHEDQMVKSLELMAPGYLLATYRRLNSDPQFAVNLPVWDELEPDDLRLPLRIQSQAGRAKKCPRKRKRLLSNGEVKGDSRYDTPLSEPNRRSPADGGAASSQGGAPGARGTVRGVGIPIGEAQTTLGSGCGPASQDGASASGGRRALSTQAILLQGLSQSSSQAAL